MLVVYADGHRKSGGRKFTAAGYAIYDFKDDWKTDEDKKLVSCGGGYCRRKSKTIKESEFISIMISLYKFMEQGFKGPAVVVNDNEWVIGMLNSRKIERRMKRKKKRYDDFVRPLKEFQKHIPIKTFIKRSKSYDGEFKEAHMNANHVLRYPPQFDDCTEMVKDILEMKFMYVKPISSYFS